MNFLISILLFATIKFDTQPVSDTHKLLRKDLEQLVEDTLMKTKREKLDQLLKADANLVDMDALVIHYEASKQDDMAQMQLETRNRMASDLNTYRDGLLKKFGFK